MRVALLVTLLALTLTLAETTMAQDAQFPTLPKGAGKIDANAAAFPELGTVPLDLPALMLCAEWDPALRPELAAGMPSLCSDLEMHVVDGAGHWVQQEDPSTVNRLLVDWLLRRFG